jgi:8-oxo-dGTP pyrophosphatase MutT (NUDIX family)
MCDVLLIYAQIVTMSATSMDIEENSPVPVKSTNMDDDGDVQIIEALSASPASLKHAADAADTAAAAAADGDDVIAVDPPSKRQRSNSPLRSDLENFKELPTDKFGTPQCSIELSSLVTSGLGGSDAIKALEGFVQTAADKVGAVCVTVPIKSITNHLGMAQNQLLSQQKAPGSLLEFVVSVDVPTSSLKFTAGAPARHNTVGNGQAMVVVRVVRDNSERYVLLLVQDRTRPKASAAGGKVEINQLPNQTAVQEVKEELTWLLEDQARAVRPEHLHFLATRFIKGQNGNDFHMVNLLIVDEASAGPRLKHAIRDLLRENEEPHDCSVAIRAVHYVDREDVKKRFGEEAPDAAACQEIRGAYLVNLSAYMAYHELKQQLEAEGQKPEERKDEDEGRVFYYTEKADELIDRPPTTYSCPCDFKLFSETHGHIEKIEKNIKEWAAPDYKSPIEIVIENNVQTIRLRA